ncbi:hypothetical protein [Mesoflavibacter profundi]|uniref:hypothetical protein n=1 Tax=Mesoflavibacter profundi TaxID=2708110 RepID=UPI003514D340
MARVDQLIEKYTAMRDMYKQFNTEGAIATVKLCDEVLQDLNVEISMIDVEEGIDWEGISKTLEKRNKNRTS